ncbi:hypothetical protein N9153_03785 [Planctomicrobium sp.]|jgi:hypothetical protein|nr:hypothetical protein [Planctomicrobium sp.]MDB4440025.1 hypothetical protein [Planctomicrobium sp.]
MKDLPKQAVVASMVVAGLVALMAILDMVMGVPFSGSGNTFMMDIIFIICSAIVGYLAWDAFREMN